MAKELPDAPFHDESQNVRDQLPVSANEDPLKPRMPFKTSYKLTRDQEDALVTFADERITQLQDQLGRVGDHGSFHGRQSHMRRSTIQYPLSFMGKRTRFTLRYYSHVEDRKLPNTLFESSNITANISQRILQQMIAKAIEFFFGKPDDLDWFTCEAVGVQNEELSEKIKKHARWKIKQCKIKERLIEAVEYAFIRGEAIVKPTHQQLSQIYKRDATILMGEDGEPMLDAHGDYICQGDAFIAAPAQPNIIQRGIAAVKGMFTGPEPGATEQTEEPQQTTEPAPGMILKRDGVTVLPDNPVWNEQEITRQLITFEGPSAGIVYFEDFLCSEGASDINTADLVAHLYDMTFMQVAQMFRGQYGEGDAAIENLQAAVTRLRDMSSASNIPKAAASQPRIDMRETDTSVAPTVPLCHVAECYVTYDADGDGAQEEIMLVLDRSNKAPIYYEYLANVTVRGQRPFKIVRPAPVDQRWYGMGGMETFESDQEFIDLMVNRYNFANSKAGRIDFWDPDATREGRADPGLRLNHGRTYTLVPGKKAEDAYVSVQLEFDQSKDFQWLIQFFVQQMQTKGGVVSGRDQAMSGMASQRTAAGINEISESGDELFGRILSHLFPGINETLQSIVDIIYANMNRVEVFNYFNGQATEVLSLSPDEVRDLPLHVTLELTRTQKVRVLETSQASQQLIGWFFGLPIELQPQIANYARQQLKALGVSGVEDIIIPMKAAPGGNQPEDKPSAVMNAIAALRKSGVPITNDEVNTIMQKAGLPPISTQIPTPQEEKAQEQAAVPAPAPQSAV